MVKTVFEDDPTCDTGMTRCLRGGAEVLVIHGAARAAKSGMPGMREMEILDSVHRLE